MAFLFLSYARENLSVARRLVDLFKEQGVEVFWDQNLRAGDDFGSEIEHKLNEAGTVLVLWSKRSRASKWVKAEANAADARGVLAHARLDDCALPLPFTMLHVADLSGWRAGHPPSNVRKLVLDLAERVRAAQPKSHTLLLDDPEKGEEVTDSHLALIHTCWRSPKHDKRVGQGQPTYRWDVAVYGSRRALDRISEVTYFLPSAYELPDGDPPSHAVNKIGAKEGRLTCFRLSQVANGHSLVRSEIKVRGQARVLHLSRYINLFNSDVRITDYSV